MPHASASFETEHASKYLQQLCKHFAHKVAVEYDATRGQAALPPGPATLNADPAGLHVTVTADTEEGLKRAKHAIDAHLVTFAFRENFETMDWQDGLGTEGAEPPAPH